MTHFIGPKYDPFENLWPLIEQMVKAGFSDRVALATDMAEAELYHHIGGGAGLASLPGEIQEQLDEKGFPGKCSKANAGRQYCPPACRDKLNRIWRTK